jgi:hypothetical protein
MFTLKNNALSPLCSFGRLFCFLLDGPTVFIYIAFMLPFNPTLHVIHLPHRTDREERFTKEFAEQCVNFRIWDGVIAEKSGEGIRLAHQQIVRWAKENDLPYVLIAEDDIIFPALGAYDFFLSQIPDPKDFDLFLGMVYSAEIQDNRIINGFSGLTMYTVSRRFYDFFLTAENHIDRWLGMTAYENVYLVCNPYVCLQSGGYSDNLRRQMTYDAYLENVEFYGQSGKRFRNSTWVDV